MRWPRLLVVAGAMDILVALAQGKSHHAEFSSVSLEYSKFSTTRVGSTGAGGGADGRSGGAAMRTVSGTGVPPGTTLISPAFGTTEYWRTPLTTGYAVAVLPCVTVLVFHSAGTSVLRVIG